MKVKTFEFKKERSPFHGKYEARFKNHKELEEQINEFVIEVNEVAKEHDTKFKVIDIKIRNGNDKSDLFYYAIVLYET